MGHYFIEPLRPLEKEIVIDKPGYSAFSHTTLHQVRTKSGIETLILTGVTTEVCVSSTLRSAVDLGYRCITVNDASASGDPRHCAKYPYEHHVPKNRQFGRKAGASQFIRGLSEPKVQKK